MLHTGFLYTVAVQVTSTCTGQLLSETTDVEGSFPHCRPAAPGAVAMYPNPATHALDFALTPPTTDEAGRTAPAEFAVSLYDRQGRLCWQGRSAAGRLHLDCAHLPRGLYGVVITQGKTLSRHNFSLE